MIQYTPNQIIGVWEYIRELDRERVQFPNRNRIYTIRRHLIRCTNCGHESERMQSNMSMANCLGCKNCSMLPRGETGLGQIYNSAKQRAEERGGSILISKSEFRNLTSSNCHYCGRPPQCTKRTCTSWGAYTYNGLDRVDSSQKDYNISNVVPCCWICNQAKSDMPYHEFIDWLENVSRFRAANGTYTDGKEATKIL